jgi:hypothetical protein
MTQPTTLDYLPVKPTPYRPVFSTRAAIVVILPAIALTIGALLPIPLEDVYKDFKVEFPPITKFWFAVSRWFVSDLGWTYLWAIAIGIPFLWARFVPPVQDPLRRQIRILTLIIVMQLVIGLFAIFVAVALFSPYYWLIENVIQPVRQPLR